MNHGLLTRLRERGVLRVAASYAVIAWLALQIADVTFDPLGLPKWVMTSLIVTALLGFPVAVALAWFYELGDQGMQRDTAHAGVARPSVHGKRRYADVAIIGVLLVAVAVLLVRQSDIGKPPPPSNPAIAVMAFENLSGDPAQEYFSDGLAVEVMDRLARVPGLKVIASSSSFSYKGKSQDARDIARQLGVTTVLEGSVRRAGSKLKLNAKLVDGATGFQIWSGSFDREVTDVFAMQAELAAAVIDAIVPAARGDTIQAPPPTSDLSAHDYYLLGLAAQRARSSERLAESVAHLERAVALDPAYAQAHAALARSLILWEGYGDSKTEPVAIRDPLKRAETAAYKALALDATLSDAHGALGNLLRNAGRAGAEDEYKRALELNPNNSIVAHDYSVLLSQQPGREAESDALGNRALELDPRAAIVWSNKLTAVLAKKGPAEFRKQLATATQIFAGDVDGLGVLALAASSTAGHPYEAYEISHALAAAGAEPVAVLSSSLPPLIAMGAYDECLARIDKLKTLGSLAPIGFAPEEMMAAGLKGDFARLEHVLTLPSRDAVSPAFRYVVDAYWYWVLGHAPEAAAALAKAGQFEDRQGGFMGTSLNMGALPAVVAIYQATGRSTEAQAMIARFQARLDKGLAGGDEVPSAQKILLAEVASASGQRAKAVRHLQEALKLAPVPERFFPELPWFKTLEGEPGYRETINELERRRADIRARVARLDATATTRSASTR